MSLQSIQQQFSAHIRNPEAIAGPAGLEPRRLKIYRELFYNNIEGFISAGFPILRQLLPDQSWHAMVRDFMIHHQCQTPYFLEISQEFLLYLQGDRQALPGEPIFMLELAHYEWVELALDVAGQDLQALNCDQEGDLLEQLPLVSPLAWSLAYQYPVHRIGIEFQPQQPDEQAVYLIVYRNRQDVVGFMEANAVTARLLELLQLEGATSGKQVLQQLAAELQHPQPDQLIASGSEILQQLHSLDIILGTT